MLVFDLLFGVVLGTRSQYRSFDANRAVFAVIGISAMVAPFSSIAVLSVYTV